MTSVERSTEDDRPRLYDARGGLKPDFPIALLIPSRADLTFLPGYWSSIIEALETHAGPICIIRPRIGSLSSPYRNSARYRVQLVGSLPSRPYRLYQDISGLRVRALICVEYGIPTLVALLARRIGNAPPVFIFQEHRAANLRALQIIYRSVLAAAADGVIANTLVASRQILRHLRVSPGRLILAHLIGPPRPAELLRANATLPTPVARPVFLYVGRLVPLKNIDLLLTAAHLLRQERHQFEVWIAGTGSDLPRLQATVQRLALQDAIRFIGQVDHSSIGHYFQAADVFVMPTLYDYRSVAVLEAMRFGMAIIDSTADGNAFDLVRHGATGLVIDPLDVTSLVSCMRTLITEPSRRDALGRRALAEVTLYTSSASVQQLISALEARLSQAPS